MVESSITGLVFFMFWLVFTGYWIVTVFLFISRMEIQPIKSRSPKLSLMSATGGYIMITSISVAQFVGIGEFPCALSHWTIWVAYALFFCPYPLRALRLLSVFNFNMKKLYEHEKLNKGVGDNCSKTIIRGPIAKSLETINPMVPKGDRESVQLPKQLHRFGGANAKVITETRAVFYMFLILVFCLVVATYRQFAVKINRCSGGCMVSEGGAYVQSLIFLTVLLVNIWSITRTRHVIDEFSINSELKMVAAAWILFFVPYLILNFFLTDCDPLRQGYPACVFENDCVNWTMVHVGHVLLVSSIALSYTITCVWPLSLTLKAGMQMLKQSASSPSFPDINVLRSLRRVLDDKKCVNVFKKFLVREFSVENLLFVLDAEAYQLASQREGDREHLRTRGKRIYDLYISSNSDMEVNIPDNVRTRIDKGIIDDPTNSHLFDEARDVLFRNMERDSFPRFLRSQSCNTLATEIRLEHEQHKRLREAQMI
eukprot:TRINITY_DN4817_c0_g1_i1.p1 TRINITY_DN4817_c0_g1~~TRINITY_DN4817_c0_g1_i1.p1  ORF type:complete len:484 (+),score=71.39 TRINITY_DN4817_c0_g1_i1:172-1623(+)